jgi:lipopolysaccharide transport system permease protein
VPLLILVTMIQALGFALSLSALTVTYRDVRFIIPFMVQILMLPQRCGVPVHRAAAYPWLRFGNPVAGLIDAFRAVIFDGWDLNVPHFVYSVVFAIAMFVWGLFYFRRTERRFADIT